MALIDGYMHRKIEEKFRVTSREITVKEVDR